MDGILPWQSCSEQSEHVSALLHYLIYTAGALDLSLQRNLQRIDSKLHISSPATQCNSFISSKPSFPFILSITFLHSFLLLTFGKEAYVIAQRGLK